MYTLLGKDQPDTPGRQTVKDRSTPYLSFVAASRNDDHGGGMLRRMSMFVRGLQQQAQRHGLRAELVLVDWNPPPDSPLLHEVLPPPPPGSLLDIRYIIVPNKVHRRWRNWEAIPLFQMIAKNVGIRRARGEFILCTNVDLLFSDKLCESLAREELDPAKMYRAVRCDVPEDVPPDAPIEEQLSYCEKNIIRTCGLKLRKPIHGQFRQAGRGLKSFLGRPSPLVPPLDTQACGDFTLLSRAAWDKIRGYPELGMYSIYVDGLGAHAAASMGYKALDFPPDHCTFHAEHQTGWMSMSVMEKIQMMQERPFLDYATYGEAVRWMWEHHQPLPINDENWGCRQNPLREIQSSGSGTAGETINA